MKIAIIGSRTITLPVELFVPEEISEIFSGGARGVDTNAEKLAKQLKLPITVLYPDYAAFGRKAPLLRNRELVNRCDAVIAVWDGQSAGTAYTISYAKRLHKDVRIFYYQRKELL